MRGGTVAIATRGLLQFALDRPRPREQSPVELVEDVARRKEHETTGDTNGNADRAAVELDCKALTGH